MKRSGSARGQSPGVPTSARYGPPRRTPARPVRRCSARGAILRGRAGPRRQPAQASANPDDLRNASGLVEPGRRSLRRCGRRCGLREVAARASRPSRPRPPRWPRRRSRPRAAHRPTSTRWPSRSARAFRSAALAPMASTWPRQPRAGSERHQQRQAGAGEDRPIAQADAGHRHDERRFVAGRLAQESELHGLGAGPFEAGNGPFRCQ